MSQWRTWLLHVFEQPLSSFVQFKLSQRLHSLGMANIGYIKLTSCGLRYFLHSGRRELCIYINRQAFKNTTCHTCYRKLVYIV